MGSSIRRSDEEAQAHIDAIRELNADAGKAAQGIWDTFKAEQKARETAERRVAELEAAGNNLEDHVRVLESLLANSGPGFTPVPATELQRQYALRDRERWLELVSGRVSEVEEE